VDGVGEALLQAPPRLRGGAQDPALCVHHVCAASLERTPAHMPPVGFSCHLLTHERRSRCAFRAARPNARQRALYQSAFALYQIARGPQIAPRRPEGPVLKPSAPTFHPPRVPRAERSECTRCAIGEADPCFVGAGLVVGCGGHVPSIRICFDPSAGQGKGSRAGGPSDRNGGNRAGQSTRDLDHAVRRCGDRWVVGPGRHAQRQ
jgi:hypothetical protein